MHHSISVDLPDDLYQAVLNAAAQSQCAPGQWIASELQSKFVTRPQPQDAEAFERYFEQYLGCIDSGDPNLSDNVRIDEDLAREYEGQSNKDA